MAALAALFIACVGSTPTTGPEEHLIPLNLDFSIDGLVDPSVPWSWLFHGLVAAEVDARVGDPGSLRLLRESEGPVGLAAYDLAAPFGGSALELSALIRRGDESQAEVRIGVNCLRLDWSLLEERSSWSDGGRIEARLSVPSDSENVQLVIEYRGQGEIDVADLQLTVDARPAGPWLPGQQSPSTEEVDFVTEHAVALTTTDPEAPLDDLDALDSMVGDASLILLGESTHGSAEFFRWKHRFVRWLSHQGAPTIFVIEDHPDKADAIDHYIHTGDGDAAALVGGLFGFWARRETLELVEWMRAATMAGDVRLTFAGVDVQVPLGAITALERYASTVGPELEQTVTSELEPMRAAWEEARYPQRAAEEYERWAASAERVRQALQDHAPGADGGALERALLDARLVWQSARVSAAADFRVRDEYLAENLAWLRERAEPGARFIVWAHNTHVRLDESAMGEHLERRYPGDVLSIGLFTADGDYVAYDGRSLRSYQLFPAPPGSVEYLLQTTGEEVVALDLRDRAAGQLLQTPLLHRNLGLWPADLGFYRTIVPAGFHALLFVDSTTSTEPLRAEPR